MLASLTKDKLAYYVMVPVYTIAFPQVIAWITNLWQVRIPVIALVSHLLLNLNHKLMTFDAPE